MLLKPFDKIVEIIKDVNTTTQVTDFIRKDLEEYLSLLKKTKDVTKGCILVQENSLNFGVMLSKLNTSNSNTSNLFCYDEISNQKLFNNILKRSLKEKIFVYIKGSQLIEKGHFILDRGTNNFSTVLPKLSNRL